MIDMDNKVFSWVIIWQVTMEISGISTIILHVMWLNHQMFYLSAFTDHNTTSPAWFFVDRTTQDSCYFGGLVVAIVSELNQPWSVHRFLLDMFRLLHARLVYLARLILDRYGSQNPVLISLVPVTVPATPMAAPTPMPFTMWFRRTIVWGVCVGNMLWTQKRGSIFHGLTVLPGLEHYMEDYRWW